MGNYTPSMELMYKRYKLNKEKDLSKSCIQGFNNSKYKNILVMDGDLQHDPKYIPKLIVFSVIKLKCD